MSQEKKLSRGKILIHEGDPIENLYFIKSGRLSLYTERNGKKIDLGNILKDQILGEKGLFEKSKMPFTVSAANDVTYLEVPIALLAPMFNEIKGLVKGVTKGTIDALADARKTIQALKIENNDIPCPDKMVPRIFASIYILANMIGKKNEEDGSILISWSALKLYTTRIFLESHLRIQSAIEILTKLKYAEMIYTKDDDGDDQLSDIKIFDIKIVEGFSDFYQYHHYKPGVSEILIADKSALKTLEFLVKFGSQEEIDRKGAVFIEYEKLREEFQKEIGTELKTSHFDILEKKGLFSVKKPRGDKVYLTFDFEEYQKTSIYWKILYEIQRWNSTGFVNMKEEEEKKILLNNSGSVPCPSCSEEISATHKFCPNCGTKVSSAA